MRNGGNTAPLRHTLIVVQQAGTVLAEAATERAAMEIQLTVVIGRARAETGGWLEVF